MERQTENYIGESEVFLDFQRKIADAATVDRSVLVIGERGSGKELAANRLHYLSKRWQKKLVTVNCAALSPSLIESELFGYEQGAFTGAVKTHKGRFEEAQGGTLFLDEIGNLPIPVQEKILRVVEYGTYERVGSSVTHEVDVRIIGATNSNLQQMCKERKFKEDLLDRLSFEVIFVPPLRERGKDILILANYFASRMAMECGYNEIPLFDTNVLNELLSYSWPGNVRELKNVVERAVYRSKGNVITNIQIDPFLNPYKNNETSNEISIKTKKESNSQDFVKSTTISYSYDNIPINKLNEAKEAIEKDILQRALLQAKGNQKEAAALMELSYDQFRGLYRKHKKDGLF